MKNLLLATLALCATLTATAQTPQNADANEGYKFTDLKTLPGSAVRDQSRSGTCWCYATLSMIEAEIMRAGGKEMDLSEMWIVRNIYFEKAVKYVRLHGSLNLAVGGQAHDVTNGITRYGIVPEEVYPGLNYGTTKPQFNEIDAVIKGYVDAVIKASEAQKGNKLTTAWQNGLNGILDAYFGVRPEKFTFEGKEYTPQSFAASLPVKMADYVELSSFTHHPFYSQFVVEVPDNWSWDAVWNLPLNEIMSTIDNALATGYAISWGADVSEKGFSRTEGLAVIPETQIENMSGTEAEKWGKLTDKEREAALFMLNSPAPERAITPEMRQEAFDNYESTDDHGMVIMGTAVDQNGTPYYKVKNSWGAAKPYDGYWYFSKPFVAYKTMTILLHKEALTKEIRKKIGIK